MAHVLDVFSGNTVIETLTRKRTSLLEPEVLFSRLAYVTLFLPPYSEENKVDHILIQVLLCICVI